VITVSVRDLVEFVCRSGNLGGTGNFISTTRAIEGTRAHQRLQQSRPAGYEPEVTVTRAIESGAFTLVVQGRIDGVLRRPDSVRIEEIKTVIGSLPASADSLHWAQAKIYAALYIDQWAGDQLEVQLVYIDLDSDQTAEFRQEFARDELVAFFTEVTAVYVEWERQHQAWRAVRDQSIKTLPFPFPGYRPGQRALAVASYRALVRARKLFAEAPTGIGKTVSALFPAVKAMGEGRIAMIFYLTAKTVGRTVTEKALADLRQAGLRLRSLTLTAKEKICFATDGVCDVAACPYAVGYWDRIKDAVQDALARESLTRPVLEEVARRHQVCPYELSLDASRWVDVVIADYNYVFDPLVYLRRFFAGPAADYAFLVDEAHNLVDRARTMFSACLDKEQILEVRRAIQSSLPRCAKALSGIHRAMLALRAPGDNARTDAAGTAWAARALPEALLTRLRQFLKTAEEWLAQNQPAPFRSRLLECYFTAVVFLRMAELYDERYVTIVQTGARRVIVRLFCLDPSVLIQKALQRGKTALFFSATLSPLDYFRELMGGADTDATLRLASPFPSENLAVLIADQIQTDFKSRERTGDQVAGAIAAAVQAHPGNYLVYFPSYQYLEQVLEHFRARCPAVPIRAQTPGMTESEREAFLAAFEVDRATSLAGFAVMGGIFGEGIDLVGERLVGVVVVGVGLPQVGFERELIRDFFEQTRHAGFDYAYRYPGINRVLQAAGRVIRSETDRGVVLLIDARFRQPGYRRLLPEWWHPTRVRTEAELTREMRRFWGLPQS